MCICERRRGRGGDYTRCFRKAKFQYQYVQIFCFVKHGIISKLYLLKHCLRDRLRGLWDRVISTRTLVDLWDDPTSCVDSVCFRWLVRCLRFYPFRVPCRDEIFTTPEKDCACDWTGFSGFEMFEIGLLSCIAGGS